MNPLITIIVPVYKVEKYLDRCVRSILNQTYNRLEIILVDDGSPDGCPKMCDEWAEKDSRIRAVHKENGGLSSARNAGLDVMSGEYVYFLDSDDEIIPETISELYALISENGCDMAMGKFLRAYENESEDNEPTQTEFIGDISFFDEDSFWTYYYDNIAEDYTNSLSNMIISCNKLIKADVFDGLRFDIGKLHEDEFIIHKTVRACKKIAVVDKAYYIYYQIGSSIMGSGRRTPRADSSEAFCGRIEYFASEGKPYTLAAFVAAFGIFSYNIIEYRKSHREVSKKIKELYVKAYRLARPYFGELGISKRVYYTTLAYSNFCFKIMRDLFALIRKDK